MPRYIIKLVDSKTKISYYLEWSTIVDAPVTYGMSLLEFKKYYQKEYGNSGMVYLDDRLKRVEKNGTSGLYPFDSLRGLIRNNFAGENMTKISKKNIIKIYCIDKT